MVIGIRNFPGKTADLRQKFPFCGHDTDFPPADFHCQRPAGGYNACDDIEYNAFPAVATSIINRGSLLFPEGHGLKYSLKTNHQSTLFLP